MTTVDEETPERGSSEPTTSGPPPPVGFGRRWPWVVGAVVVGVLVAWLVVVPLIRPHTFQGTVLQSTTPIPALELTSSTGERVDLASFRGDLLVLYFGYTHCPDVCPTTLATLAEAREALGDDGDEVQVAMVTVDPQRDTPEALAEYVAHFDESFLGLTGTDEELAEAATLFGVYAAAQEGTEATGYLVDHTATVMVVDRDGYLKLLLPFGTSAEGIAADLAYLLR